MIATCLARNNFHLNCSGRSACLFCFSTLKRRFSKNRSSSSTTRVGSTPKLTILARRCGLLLSSFGFFIVLFGLCLRSLLLLFFLRSVSSKSGYSKKTSDKCSDKFHFIFLIKNRFLCVLILTHDLYLRLQVWLN